MNGGTNGKNEEKWYSEVDVKRDEVEWSAYIARSNYVNGHTSKES